MPVSKENKESTKRFSKKDYEKMAKLDKNGTEIVNGVSIHDDGTGIRIPGVLSSPLTDEEIEKDLACVYEKMDKNGEL
jgi:hypothetical protein